MSANPGGGDYLPNPPTDLDDDARIRRYTLATSDPGAFTPRAGNYGESIPRWAARAAVAVADAEQAELRSRLGLALRTLTAERIDHADEVARLKATLKRVRLRHARQQRPGHDEEWANG